MKPIIGISCSLGARKEEWIGRPGLTYDYVKREYHRRVEEHGGIPLLLPVVRGEETARGMAACMDGLLLTGGEDVDPARYNAENCWPGSIIHPERDRFEWLLLQLADERRLPVLGICRGVQVMNAFYGGTLYQDLSLRPGTGTHRSPEPDVYLPHTVRVREGSRLIQMTQRPDVEVNSRHHQTVSRVAPGFSATAFADDGVIEAIEGSDGSLYRMGVQWHPELMPEAPATAALFKDLIRSAATERA